METLPLTLQVHRSLERIAAASRGELCKRATDLAEVPWVKQALWKAPDRDIRVLGRFDLIGTDGRVPWPSVLIEVRRRPQHAGQADRRALVAVYVDEEGEWACSERESDKIPWRQYRGHREGQPSVLNGDDPQDAEEVVIPQP